MRPERDRRADAEGIDAAGDQQAGGLESGISLRGSTPNGAHVALSGCPCGCLVGVDCLTERPAVDRNGHCCGTLGFDSLATCARLGIDCSSGCVRVAMGWTA